ncbi:MAG: tetratricopeptide repeat protein [Candidatus Thorarchaeota archaeon]
MYEHYDSSERIFVDREEYLEWMNDALERCRKESVILHLRGIGGIGKSSLVDHWHSSFENCIVLDFARVNELYDRLDVLARGAAHLGVTPRRFDVLWHIRQRFIKGVEPSEEKGRGWVLEVLGPLDAVTAFPVVGISKAISVAAKKLKNALTGRIDELGEWLEDRLGEEYAEKLLEVLWKEPSHAEFLYLDALVEDLNSRADLEEPVLVMLDGFEVVDNENLRWRYSGRNVSESELWYIFLSSIRNCVGVVASRRPPPRKISEEKVAEESELTELDEESCRELLERRGIPDRNLQAKIISVSGGNPFVINCICDIHESGGLSIADVGKLGADTLEQVRVKTWRRLFRETEGLLDIIDRAGLVPYMDRRIMGIIAPSMKSAHWDRLTRLSFVRDQSDGIWTLHDLARELVLTELGDKENILVQEVGSLLEKAAERDSDLSLLGMALSTKAIIDEQEAMAKTQTTFDELLAHNRYRNAHTLLSHVRLSSKEGIALLQGLQGNLFATTDRVGEAEEAFRDALELYGSISKSTQISGEVLTRTAKTLKCYASMLERLDRPSDAIKAYREAVNHYRLGMEYNRNTNLKNLADTLCDYASSLLGRHLEIEAKEAIQEALKLYQELASLSPDSDAYQSGVAKTHLFYGYVSYQLEHLSDSIESSLEGVRIFDRLATKEPDIYTKDHADARLRLGSFLTRSQRVEEGLKERYKSLKLYQELAQKAPDVYLKDVAAVSSGIGFWLYSSGRTTDAEALIRKSIQTFRELAEKAPELYLDDLGACLRTLGSIQRDTGRLLDSEKSFKESIRIFKNLEEAAPQVYGRGQCNSFVHAYIRGEYSRLLLLEGKMKDAEDILREAYSITKAIEDRLSYHKHRFFMVGMLHNLAIVLKHSNRLDESNDALLEVLEEYRELYKRSPTVFAHSIASVQNNIGMILKETSRLSEAEEVYQESLNIYRELYEKAPLLFNTRFATTSNNYGILLKRIGRLDEAGELLEEALDISRRAGDENPILHLPRVAMILNNLGLLFLQEGNLSEAESVLEESLEIRRNLATKNPDLYLPVVSNTLNNLGIVLAGSNKTGEAKQVFQEALDIRRQFAGKSPQLFSQNVASALNNLGSLFKKASEYDDAERAYYEAIEIWEKLASSSPQVFNGYLAISLSNLYTLFSELAETESSTKEVMNRLNALGVSNLDSSEWIEEEEEEEIWFDLVF